MRGRKTNKRGACKWKVVTQSFKYTTSVMTLETNGGNEAPLTTGSRHVGMGGSRGWKGDPWCQREWRGMEDGGGVGGVVVVGERSAGGAGVV